LKCFYNYILVASYEQTNSNDMAAFDMERFTNKAADSLYSGYKKGVFDGNSSFYLSTSILLSRLEEHLVLFEEINALIFSKILDKFGGMVKIYGNRKWGHKILKGETETKVVFGLFDIKKEKKDGASVLKRCSNCRDVKADVLKCGACKDVYYCNKECQKADWGRHKGMCCKSL